MRKIRGIDQNKLCVGARFSRVAEDLITRFEVCDTFTHGSYATGNVPTRRPRELQGENLS
jgi:hypothetical protein